MLTAPRTRRRARSVAGAVGGATIAPKRVRLHIDKRRAQLLRLGIELFSGRGYDDISIDDVAVAAGISKGLLYHYFGGKREFYVETVRAASLHLQQLTAPDPTLAPGARLRAAVDAHLDYVRKHGPVYAAVYRSGAAVAPEVDEILEEHREVVMRFFLRNLGVSRPPAVLRAALRAWIAMVEGASLDLIAHPELKPDELRELLVVAYAALIDKAMRMRSE